MPEHGLWNLVSRRPIEASAASDRQIVAASYLVGDMPDDAILGFETASDLLSVRSYVIGVLANLSRQGPLPHPREAMWWALQEAYINPAALTAIRKWNRDRYFEDRGPARVGGTRHYDYFRDVILANCRSQAPSGAQSIAVRDAELRSHGLGRLLIGKATIEYPDGNEITRRAISDIHLSSRWPWWAYWLIRAPSFISVDAFCHLRQDHRTFAAIKIVSAS